MKPGPHYQAHIKRAVQQLACIGLGITVGLLCIVVILFSVFQP